MVQATNKLKIKTQKQVHVKSTLYVIFKEKNILSKVKVRLILHLSYELFQMENADVSVFQMLPSICNCFELPRNEIVAVFYYFAMYRPVILQVRNILKLGKAILFE